MLILLILTIIVLTESFLSSFVVFDRNSLRSLLTIQDNNNRDGKLPDTYIKVKKRIMPGMPVSSITSGGTKSRGLLQQGKPRSLGLVNPNRLKIISGTAKGKKIESPDIYLRPMMAKVREAVFSSLEYMGLFDANNTRVLDIFSGSGSVGLEALSRGACHTTFVDFSQECIDTALLNSKNLGFDSQVRGVCATAQDVLTNPLKFSLKEPYQLVTLTPPYEEVVYKELVEALLGSTLITENSIVLVEYPVEMGNMPYIIGDKLYGIRNRKYGRTVIATYVNQPTKLFDMRPDEFESKRKY